MTPPTAAVSRRPRKRRAAEAVAAPIVQQDWSNLDPNDLSSPALFINRELSWLSFNERVLAQAQDASHPLLERVKFLAITGTNLDEFFMVRVATILKKFRAGIEEVDAFRRQQRPQRLAPARRLIVDLSERVRANRRQLLFGGLAVDRDVFDAGAEFLQDGRDADHEELVEVVR